VVPDCSHASMAVFLLTSSSSISCLPQLFKLCGCIESQKAIVIGTGASGFQVADNFLKKSGGAVAPQVTEQWGGLRAVKGLLLGWEGHYLPPDLRGSRHRAVTIIRQGRAKPNAKAIVSIMPEPLRFRPTGSDGRCVPISSWPHALWCRS